MKLKHVQAGQKFMLADPITGKVHSTNTVVYTATHDAQPARARNYVVVLTTTTQVAGHGDDNVELV